MLTTSKQSVGDRQIIVDINALRYVIPVAVKAHFLKGSGHTPPSLVLSERYNWIENRYTSSWLLVEVLEE